MHAKPPQKSISDLLSHTPVHHVIATTIATVHCSSSGQDASLNSNFAFHKRQYVKDKRIRQKKIKQSIKLIHLNRKKIKSEGFKQK